MMGYRKPPYGGAMELIEDQRARIDELERVLKIVDDDVRHHLRSDEIHPALIRPRAIKAVRNALAR